jgi:glutathione S-transferase
MTDLTLVYFKMRALAEAPQMMLRYRDHPYHYAMGWDYFGRPWAEAKSEATYRQLPMLVTEDGTRITQTGAIMRYLARRLDLMPTDSIQAALADEVFEGAHELFMPLNPVVNFRTGDAFREAAESCLPALSNRFADFERLLARQDGPFFLGKTPCFCDFAAFHHIDLSHFLDESILVDLPRLHEFAEAMRALPGIGAYLAERPELIGVGVGPKLVIDGVPVPTGVTAD